MSRAPQGASAYSRPWVRAADSTPVVRHTYVNLSSSPDNYIKTDDRTVYLFRDGDTSVVDTLTDALKRRRCAIWRDSAMLGRGAVALIGET